MRPYLLTTLLTALGLAAGLLFATVTRWPHTFSDPSFGAAANTPEEQLVKVTAKREGNRTRFFVENKEHCEVTMTFEFSITNLKSSVEFPYTQSFPAGKVTEGFCLDSEVPEKKWEYAYTNYYKLGGVAAQHDDRFLYALPYASGSKFKVTQAFGGSFSHKGSNKYAIDWKMPEGTPVHASRGGTVVKIKDDSETGGRSMKYDRFNNFVLIRHADGTLGHYCHLLKQSVVVKVGDEVTTGDLLANSGNTGFSSGPHLHFCVFRTTSGKARVSVPIRFRTDEDSGTTLVAGKGYRATPASGRSETTIVAAGAGS